MEKQKITCIRAPIDNDDPYLRVARATAQDVQMSIDARGLLLYILSLPSDWVAHPKHLAKVNFIGRDKVYKIFNTLMEFGYCEKIEVRDSKGRHESVTYMFYEKKQQRLIDLYKEKCISLKREIADKACNPFPENPDTDNPDTENKDTTYNISLEKKKKKKRNLSPGIEFDHESQQFINISEADKSEWATLYPGVDIERELVRMRQWLIDPKNPERDGHRTFITRWLDKAFEDSKKKPRKSTSTTQDAPEGLQYNGSIAYSILHEEGIDEYVNYLKDVSDKKYYKNYQKGNYENYYIEYTKQKGN